MTKEILTSENLIEIYENLNDFAKHNQNLGGQKAHRLIKEIWDGHKSQPKIDTHDQKLVDEGLNRAFSVILKELYRQFVP